MRYTMVAWMKDRPGVLNRVAGLLRRRNFNIDSLQVGRSEQPGISRMTFVVNGNEHMVDQCVKQLRKLIDVTAVEAIGERQAVVHELVMLRVSTAADKRSEIMQLVELYNGQIVDVALDSLVVQIVGSEERVNALIELLDHFGIEEMVRTGPVAMLRGTSAGRRVAVPLGTVAAVNGAYKATPVTESRLTTGGV